jgi:hypothetical protein
MESLGEILTAKCLRPVHDQVSKLTMSYPQGRFLQLTSSTMVPFWMLSLEMFQHVVGIMSRHPTGQDLG